MEFLYTSNYSSPLSVSEDSPSNNLSKRQKVVKEIYNSEHKYISQLQTIVDVFLKPIRVGSLLPPNSISIIFSNVEGLLGVNIELLNCMKQKSLGDAFSYLAPFLKMYASYSSNYQMASELLERSIRRDRIFADFIEIQELCPECNYLNLQSLLITPVQRIPRYKLLLDELLKHTKHTHIEYSKISSAVQQISAIASFINEYIRQHENSKKMIAIQSSLSGVSIPGIIVPGRTFIKEGKLMKICRRRPKERMIFLFSDMLMYARANILNTGSYICRGVLPLIDAQVQVLLNDERVPGISGLIQLTTSDNNVIALYSNKEEETFQWADIIQATILELQNDILSGTPVTTTRPTKYHHHNDHFTSFEDQTASGRSRLETLAFPGPVSPIGNQMPMIIETPSSPISPSPPLMRQVTPLTSSPIDKEQPVTLTEPLVTPVTLTEPLVTPITLTSVIMSSPTIITSADTRPIVTSSVPIATSSVPIATSSVPIATSSVPITTSSVPISTSLPSTSSSSNEETAAAAGRGQLTEMEIEDTPNTAAQHGETTPLLRSSPTANERGSKCCIIS